MVQKVFFDNETANSIADPETYNRSDNKKVDAHIDHTSLPGGPNTSFVAVDATPSSPPEPIIFFPEDSLAPLSTVFSTPHPPRYVVNISESREHRHLREDFNPSTFELVRENPGYNLVISRSIA